VSRPARLPAGFTLIELVVSLLVSAIVIAAAVSLLVGQQRIFQTSSSDRGLQETARVAMGEIGDNLRMAGFGVDPGLAFDFGLADNLTMKQAPVLAGVTVKNPGYRCVGGPVVCRDQGPDEIVFVARDPYFGHRLSSVPGSNSIVISGPLNVPLYKGQILQLLCSSGTMLWAYVTVGAYVPSSAAATVAVPLLAAGGGALDFPTQNAVTSDACFSDGTALVTKVDRYHYFLQSYDAAGNVVVAQSVGSRPYLVLEQGLTDQNNAPIQALLSPDVEDLQFAYLFPRSVTTALQLVGATPGVALAAGAAGVDLAPAAGVPGYGSSPGDASASTQHPANIRAVRISLVVRSATADIKLPDTQVPAAGNRAAFTGLPGYRRLVFETTVAVPNLDARYPYFPSYSSNGGADNLNVGGG
jgi:type IV pilus assembly protein PilW